MSAPLRVYIDFVKPRIIFMVLVVTALGYFLALGRLSITIALLLTLCGSGLAAAGSAILNNFLERELDGRMDRTRGRALPRGLITPASALCAGVLCVLGGTSLLVWQVNLLTGFLALLTAFLYVLVYTPLKRITWLNTAVGAIPGALPPMGGWTAATDSLDAGAWALFLVLFVWQFPHFYSIAWILRDDYARGGFKMLPVLDPDGVRTMRQIMLFSVLLVPTSLLPSVLGLCGPLYAIGMTLASLFMLAAGYRLSQTRSMAHARGVLRASVIYLPALMLLTAADLAIFG